MALLEELDPLDKKILNALLEDSRVAFTELAKKFRIAPATVHLRVGKLKDAGVLEGSHARVNYNKIGIDVFSFVGVSLKQARHVDTVVQKLEEIPEVFEANYTTGTYSLLIKVAVRNMRALHLLLSEKIQAIEEIQSTETFIILNSPIDRKLQL